MKNKYVKSYESFNGETFNMYSGITKESWEKIWQDKNFIDRLSNVTSDLDFASDYSYNFKTGEYEDLVVLIKNIPLEAFVSYREDGYEDDDDFIQLNYLSSSEKKLLINSNSLFLVNLFPYKDDIKTELISTN